MGKLSFGNKSEPIVEKQLEVVPEIRFIEVPVEIEKIKEIETVRDVIVEKIIEKPIIQIDELKLNEMNKQINQLNKKIEDLSAINNSSVIYCKSQIEELQDNVALLNPQILIQSSNIQNLKNDIEILKTRNSLQDQILEADMHKYEKSMKMLENKIFQQNVFFGLVTIVLMITSLVFILNQ